MSKLKNPLISLGATGSLADTITFTRRRRVDIVEKKPIPPYQRTLPQNYQRWNYEDGIFYWKALSDAQRFVWQSNASRHHMTGFAYCMRYYLTYLPDLIGGWHLDRESGGLAQDFSRNDNDGAVIGASPSSGPISGGLSFDGLNDYVNFGSAPSLDSPTEITIECLFNFATPQAGAWSTLISKGDQQYEILLNQSGALWLARGGINLAGTYYRTLTNFILSPNTWYHVAFVYPDRLVYINGFDRTNVQQQAVVAIVPANVLCLASRSLPFGLPLAGLLDQCVIYNRPLASEQILNHAERSYPI